MKEVWRDVKDYEGYYQVSNKGRVKSLDRKVKGKNNSTITKKSMIRKLQTSHKGYKVVRLQKQGVAKHCQVHRLVLQAFRGNKNNKPQVNHIDCNKTNNDINNLEWATAQENMDHAKTNNLLGEFSKKRLESVMDNLKKAQQSRRRKVRQMNKKGEVVGEFTSIVEASEMTGTDGSKITMCCRGDRKTSNGFRWEYVDD